MIGYQILQQNKVTLMPVHNVSIITISPPPKPTTKRLKKRKKEIRKFIECSNCASLL